MLSDLEIVNTQDMIQDHELISVGILREVVDIINEKKCCCNKYVKVVENISAHNLEKVIDSLRTSLWVEYKYIGSSNYMLKIEW